MKVVIINNDLRIFWKGRLVFLRRFLNQHNIELSAVELFGKGSPYSFDGYTNERDWWRCLFPGNSAQELSKEQIAEALFIALDKINPDVIISSSIVFYAGALGMRWAKKNHKKFIMFDDARPWQVKRNFIVQGIKQLLISQSDALWLPSKEYDTDYLYIKKNGVSFFYGYNCIDNDLFKPPPVDKLRHKKILCVARLVPIKNIESLLIAWQTVEQQPNDYQLIIAGGGPEYDNLVTLSSDLELKRVLFAGAVNHQNINNYYLDADALILPSHSETWGLVVNEAMASALPVLLSNKVNACASLLREGINGFSFEPTDTAAMAAAILRFIDLDDATKQEMSVASLNIINNMSYTNMGTKLLDALHKIVSSKFKKPGIFAGWLIKLWYGRYNTSGWDKL